MNSAQQEQLLVIGSYLQQVRQEQGKTIEEAANQIFIRPALVRAIEQGDWESLPEPVFVKGFIRRYAEFLGLNGLEIAKPFELTPVLPTVDPKTLAPLHLQTSAAADMSHPVQGMPKPETSASGTRSRSSSPDGMPWVWGLLALLPLLGGGIWLATRGGSDRPAVTQTAPPPETTPAPVTPPPETPPEPAAVPEPAPAAATPAAPITFEVDLDGDSWMRIIADGEEVYEGVLTTGTQQSWTAKTELRVTAGNSGAVKYSFNGSTEQTLGDPGAVSNLTLTPETNTESDAAAEPAPPAQ